MIHCGANEDGITPNESNKCSAVSCCLSLSNDSNMCWYNCKRGKPVRNNPDMEYLALCINDTKVQKALSSHIVVNNKATMYPIPWQYPTAGSSMEYARKTWYRDR